MYQTLYRKYRPRTFSDVCGQDRITAVLRRQVEEGTMTHAYLFCGTRGTGKTTCAKILAKAANCLQPSGGEPCNECENCRAADRGELLDILEVDAASNTGVDNIRKLCEELNFMPAQGKKRVYIIDEVHMLSIGAFNALLKTLEEPPAHALFILATTELHKVPATVRSRCQCFTFHRISSEDIASRVLFVSGEEKIPLDPSGARLIARLSDGAMRDALSLLELCVGQKPPLDEKALDRLFGLGDSESIKELALSALRHDAVRALELLNELYQSMGDLKEILSQVLGALRDVLLYRVGLSFETNSNRTDAQQNELREFSLQVKEEELLYAISVFEETLVRFERLGINKKTLCEIALLRVCNPQVSDSAEALSARVSALEKQIGAGVLVAKETQSSPPSSKASVSKNAGNTPETSPELEGDCVPWTEDAPAENSAAASLTEAEPEVPSVHSADRQAASDASVSGCNYAEQLVKTLAAKDPLLSSFCNNLRLEEREHVLYFYGEPFTITMLRTREAIILNSARALVPELTAVRFVESNVQENSGSSADLGEF